MLLRPKITTCLPPGSFPLRIRSSTTPAGVAGANREDGQQGTARRPTTPADAVTAGPEQEPDESDGERSQPGWGNDRAGFI